jgi:vitamin B12 transporter
VKSTNRTDGDFNEGNDLARRPRHALTVSADWTPTLTGAVAGLTIGGDIRLVGDSFDNASNATRLDGYVIGTVRASVPIGEHFELFGRIENVTDEDYRVVGGYGTAGRSAFAGVRAKL